MQRRTFLRLGIIAGAGLLAGEAVTTAVRMLLAAAGAGAGFHVDTLTVSTVASAPNGGWTQIPDPKVVVVGGTAFLGWVDGTSHDVEYAQWDIASEVLSTPVALGHLLVDDGPPDNHNSGSILVRSSDSKLLAAYSGHADDRVRLRISTNPLDATAWGSEQVVNPALGTCTYTYQTLVEEGGTLYWFTRCHLTATNTGRLAYATSTDGGATWSSWTLLLTGASGKVPYWRIWSNGAGRIDIFTTDDSPTSSSLYHFYIDTASGNRYQSDGTLIATSLPIGVADMTLVKSNAAGAVWSWGNCWDGSRPATVLMRYVSASDNEVMVARWTGSAWQVDAVATAGGVVTGNQYASGAAISKTDPNLVYMARKVSGVFEMYRYRSTDDGATWTGSQLTSGSAHDNIWPDSVTGGGRDMEAVWLYGDYTSDTSFDFGIRAVGWR